jgi:hypothetical protein
MEQSLRATQRLLQASAVIDQLMAEIRGLRETVRAAEERPTREMSPHKVVERLPKPEARP